MVALLLHDYTKYPVKGTKPLEMKLGDRIYLTEQELKEVSSLVAAEVAKMEKSDSIDWEALSDNKKEIDFRKTFEVTN